MRSLSNSLIYHHLKKNNIPWNIPKETKDLYSKNYKTRMKQIKDDFVSDREIYHVPRLEKSI